MVAMYILVEVEVAVIPTIMQITRAVMEEDSFTSSQTLSYKRQMQPTWPEELMLRKSEAMVQAAAVLAEVLPSAPISYWAKR